MGTENLQLNQILAACRAQAEGKSLSSTAIALYAIFVVTGGQGAMPSESNLVSMLRVSRPTAWRARKALEAATLIILDESKTTYIIAGLQPAP